MVYHWFCAFWYFLQHVFTPKTNKKFRLVIELKVSKILVQFIGILTLGLVPAFLVQNHFTETNQRLSLGFTYSFNLFFTLPFVLLIFVFINKLKRHIGFIFMGLGFVKITAFLVYTKWQEIDVNRDNFLMFFVPYFICLLAEIFVLSKYLNKADF